eukprot:CAMPEP_0181467880 /NCGR_PEP_ID=MMETSP1110-20121109/37209_1 /TAXON_ID=174948 /ORGANISM="Symbiodinium sp., Strain CCMP421" /LENGTH=166 /DNA_ID=CAMNT_0023592725 /DNA_START=67 /DNA_END=564 /DNA_ORIENTATION=+
MLWAFLLVVPRGLADLSTGGLESPVSCGCDNKKGVLAPKVSLPNISIAADPQCSGAGVHASLTGGKFCGCDKGKATNWKPALTEAQKVVDAELAPLISELQQSIRQLQEEMGAEVDASSVAKFQPKVTAFPRRLGEGVWACCCQSGAAGKCRSNAEMSGRKSAHHE